MTYFRDRIIQGNVLDVASSLTKKIAMIITSPPYWDQRDYGTELQLWDADPDCQHEWVTTIRKGQGGGIKSKKVHVKNMENFQITKDARVLYCKHCSAIQCELGREPTPELFVKHLCDIFDTLKPSLYDWGSLYVNLGDKYYGSGGAGTTELHANDRWDIGRYNSSKYKERAKSLALIPFMFALEMIQRGWILRNDIIWQKPNPMPQSASDRFTNDYEHLFFFVKNKDYYFDQQFETANVQQFRSNNFVGGRKYAGEEYNYTKVNGRVVRNKRAIWNIPTSSFKGNHFATFPLELCKTPILASCPTQICRMCGLPVKKKKKKQGDSYTFNTIKCECNAGFDKGIVLDPFFGRGTTGKMALLLDRDFIGIELNPKNIDMAVEYLSKDIAPVLPSNSIF